MLKVLVDREINWILSGLCFLPLDLLLNIFFFFFFFFMKIFYLTRQFKKCNRRFCIGRGAGPNYFYFYILCFYSNFKSSFLVIYCLRFSAPHHNLSTSQPIYYLVSARPTLLFFRCLCAFITLKETYSKK